MAKRLTKKRAKIIAEHFVPLLEANLPHTDGDLASAYEQYTDTELQDAIDALYYLCYRRAYSQREMAKSDE